MTSTHEQHHNTPNTYHSSQHHTPLSNIMTLYSSQHHTPLAGWLRNCLWSERTQVIQSYNRDAISAHTFIFITSHSLWSFSLMFLYSGRAYWQELIESIIWAHTKIKITPHIQPRALNITQGRRVGSPHFILGGIGCTWSFLINRILVLTS